jgi:hypothetical protein
VARRGEREPNTADAGRPKHFSDLKCASCHDSFINDWTLADSYGLASIYSDKPLEMYRCDAPTGKKASMKFLYPELGNVDPSAPKTDRLKKLAEIVTSERNGRLTRTIVNRVWARFMGRGIIEPVDEMDNPAWSQDLLDWLAADLAENGYDLKHTIKLILTSRAYQLPPVAASEGQSKDFVFKGPLIRRLSAEQFLDALSEVTGVWERPSAANLDLAALSGKSIDPNFQDEAVQPKWIWNNPKAASKADPNTIYFRRVVNLASTPVEAKFVISCDNSFKLYINGKQAGSGKDQNHPSIIDGRKYLREGINVIAVMGRNGLGAPEKPDADQANPAGLWLYARVRGSADAQSTSVMDFGTDSNWLWTVDADENWDQPDFAPANWSHAAELGGANNGPWKLGPKLAETVANLGYLDHVRASLANNDSLMTALGRPNREQVVTTRSSAATTLQALELTNGSILAKELNKAGEEIAGESSDASQLVDLLYKKALGRAPTSQEKTLSMNLLGSPVQSSGVEDLLWAMAMLPEFQLIY